MDVTHKFYFECLKLALKGETIQDIPESIDYKKLFKIALNQGVVVILYYALKDKIQELPKNFVDLMKKAVSLETGKDIQSSFDKEIVIKALEENGIDFMPMKGYFLKEMYPKTEMRYCSDCDILVDPKKIKQVKKILLSLGLKIDHRDSHHDVFFFPHTQTIFEIHKKLFVGELQNYFGVGFERAFLKENYKHFYILNKEDFYISVLAHYAYHFNEGAGVGAKSLCDIYVLRNHDELDYKYIDNELKKCNLLKFKEKFEKAVNVVFNNEEGNEFTEKLLYYIARSGYLENKEYIGANKSVKEYAESGNAKRKATLRKIFPKKENIYFTYPFIKKLKLLLPIGYFLRWIRVMFKSHNGISELKSISNANNEQIEELNNIKNNLGLK